MFRRWHVVAAALLIVQIMPLPVRAEAGGARRDLGLPYARVEQAINQLDMRQYAALLLPGFTFTERDGRTSDREEFLLGMDLFSRRHGPFRVSTQSVQVLALRGNEAVVIATVKVQGPSIEGGERTMPLGRDTWVRTAAGWRLKHTESLE